MNKLYLTIDVEDWFCVRNMNSVYPYEKWDRCEVRIRKGLDFILNELSKQKVKATFFVLGWLVERYPDIITDIYNEGHEIASHGFNHQPLDLMTKESFREDLTRWKLVVHDLIPDNPRGYRAPSFSITEKTLWALTVLKEEGFVYDSSIYPTTHPNYGIKSFSVNPCVYNGILEVPMTNSNIMGINFPISGGGYFRLYPYWLFAKGLKKRLSQGDAILYFHPWEFDPNQPKINLPPSKRFRHYVGLNKNRNKFKKLLNDFEFSPLEDNLRKSFPKYFQNTSLFDARFQSYQDEQEYDPDHIGTMNGSIR